VRISAQLIECVKATTLWSNRFDRELTDIFELQDEIANAVADALKTAFAASPQPQSIDPAAYDLYLRAREHAFTPELALGADTGDPREAIPLYEQAVALAPSFAAAWAGLASARAYQVVYGRREQTYAALRADVMDAAHTALRLDPGSGLAYSALALLEPPGRHLERAALLDKALAAAPNDPRILGSVSSHWFIVGRHRESLVYVRQAHEMDPLSQPGAYAMAAQTGIGGDYEESQRLFDTFRAKWPTYLGLTVMALNIAAWEGDWNRFEALAKFAGDAGLDGPQLYWAVRTGRAIRDHDTETLGSVSSGLRNQLSRTGSVRLDSIFAAVQLGLKEEAFQAVDEASFAHMSQTEGPLPAGGWSPGLLFMARANRAMIEDPRFVGLCAKLGLCDYWVRTGKWPDCADGVPYDLRAESRRQVGA
jgi:tetratricopeptide (TPR) repeat protein